MHTVAAMTDQKRPQHPASDSPGIGDAETALDRVTKILPAEQLRSFRAALKEHRGDGLSEHASRLLVTLCTDARRAGILPEQLISELKRQIGTITLVGDDPPRRRTRVEQAVTRCIHAFYSASGSGAEDS